jgi:PAS domain S-box-containing protein
MAEIIELNTGLDLESVLTAREVAERDEFSRVIINASVDGIITYDREGSYTLWSPSMERLTGVKSVDVIGRRSVDVFPFLKESGLDIAIERSLRGEAVKSPPMHFMIPGTDKRCYTEQQNFPLFNEFAQVTGGLAIVRDLKELQIRFDALIERNRQLEARALELEDLLCMTLTKAGEKIRLKND